MIPVYCTWCEWGQARFGTHAHAELQSLGSKLFSWPTIHIELIVMSTRATRPTQRPNSYKYIGGQSIFNGVNLPIGPSAGTINYGLFVGSGGSVLLEEGH